MTYVYDTVVLTPVPLRYSAPAPDFTLPASNGGEVTLSSYRGRADVVVVFYCYDWGGI